MNHDISKSVSQRGNAESQQLQISSNDFADYMRKNLEKAKQMEVASN